MNTNNLNSRGLVLIADEMHLSLMPMLEKIGYTPDYRPEIKRKEVIEILSQYKGLIIRSKTFVDAELLENASQLLFIGRAGAGLDLIDIAEVEKRKIHLFAANEGNRVAVAEHVVGMLLCLTNNLIKADKEVKAGIWHREQNRGYELMGKTVGIIGYGHNGSETAKRLATFGCKVLAYDRFKTNFSNQHVKEATMEQIFEEADILTIHAPLTEETLHMIDVNYFDKFKKPIFFVNAARGEIVVLKDLLGAIEKGKVRGACLDVLENEKLATLTTEQQITFDKLIDSEKVIFSPHIAGWTFESYQRINEVLIEKIQKITFTND